MGSKKPYKEQLLENIESNTKWAYPVIITLGIVGVLKSVIVSDWETAIVTLVGVGFIYLFLRVLLNLIVKVLKKSLHK